MLHNIALPFGEPEVGDDQPQGYDMEDRQVDAADGIGVRSRLAEVFFS